MPVDIKDLIIFLNILGLGQSVLLAMALFLKKSGKSISHNLLGAISLSLAAIILNSIMILTGYELYFTAYQDLANSLSFWLGPLIYAYTLSFTTLKKPITKSLFLHFIIPGSYLFMGVVMMLTQGTDLYQEWHKIFYHKISFVLFYFQILGYILWSIHHLNSADLKSYRPANIGLKIILWSFLVIWLFNLMFSFFPFYRGGTASLTTLLFCVLILILAIIEFSCQRFPSVDNESRKKYQGSNLTDLMLRSFASKIEQELQQNKLYLSKDLNLASFSEELDTPSRIISQVINQVYRQNFSDFINHYRILEVKSKIADPQHRKLTIFGIAQESGFRSASAFYEAFKKNTGLTPTQYYKQVSST